MQKESRARAQKKKLGSRIVAVVAAVVSVCFWAVLITGFQRMSVRREKDYAQTMLETVTHNMQASIKDYFMITRFWSSFIYRYGTPEPEEFYKLCDALVSDTKTLVSVGLAPEGIVSYNYPKGGANILGTNMFTETLRASIAEWSRLTSQTTLNGPLATGRSGMVFEICSPVSVSDGSGGKKFWGFTITAIRRDNFFEETRLYALEEDDYDYQLKRINAQRGKLEMVACSTPHELHEPVSITFPLENTAWTLLIAPKNGWTWKTMYVLFILIGVVFTLLITFTASSLWRLIVDERTFKRMSYVDSLTGLYNSRKFYEDLEALQKNMSPYALLYLDLNDFKPVNDNFGHAAGDQLLSVVALKLGRCVRGGTGVYRVGGDEFTILIPNDVGMEALESLCVRIKTSLAQPIVLDTATVHIGTSIGYARAPEDGWRYSEVIEKAEAIMYADKKQQHARR